MQSTIKQNELLFANASVNKARYHSEGIKFGGSSEITSGSDVLLFDESQVKILTNSVTLGNKENNFVPVLNDLQGLLIRTFTSGFTTPSNCVDGSYTNISPIQTQPGTDGATGVGSGAIFSCQVIGGAVTSITVLNSGSNYEIGNLIYIDKAAVGSPDTDVIITIQKQGIIELNGAVQAESMNVTGDILIGEKKETIGHDIVLFAQNTYFDSSYGDMAGQHNAGDIYANGNVVADSFDNTSDGRYKTNIRPLCSELSSLLYNLQPVSYQWKDQKKNQDIKFGFLAQDVQQIFPNIVREFSKTHLTLDYIQFIAPIIAEMKSLQQRQLKITEKLQEIVSLVPVPEPVPVQPPKVKKIRRKL